MRAVQIKIVGVEVAILRVPSQVVRDLQPDARKKLPRKRGVATVDADAIGETGDDGRVDAQARPGIQEVVGDHAGVAARDARTRAHIGFEDAEIVEVVEHIEHGRFGAQLGAGTRRVVHGTQVVPQVGVVDLGAEAVAKRIACRTRVDEVALGLDVANDVTDDVDVFEDAVAGLRAQVEAGVVLRHGRGCGQERGDAGCGEKRVLHESLSSIGACSRR